MPESAELRLSTVKAVFFDFGDTLAALSPSKEELFQRAAHSIGMELGLEAIRRAYQVVDFRTKYSSVHVTDREGFYRDFNEQLCEALGISSRCDELHPALIAQFKREKKWQLIAEVPEALRRLRALKLPLALVANWDSNLPELTERLGIRDAFSVIVASQAAGVEKPDPAIFLRAARELSLEVENDHVLYVGNEYRADVMGARSAGLTPVLIDRNRLYPHADCLCFPSLLDWLDAMQ